MTIGSETLAILGAAARYAIQKSEAGVTVGLQFDADHYAEATVPDGDVDAAVREAFRRLVHQQPQPALPPGHVM